MKKHRRRFSPNRMIGPHPNADLAVCWALRLLLELEGYRDFGGYDGNVSVDGSLLRALGLGHLENEEVKMADFIKLLEKRHAHYDRIHPKITGSFKTNLAYLKILLGLSGVEQKILSFAIMIHSHEGLERAGGTLQSMTSEPVIRVLSKVLKEPLRKVRAGLSTDGMLARSGLLRLARGGASELSCKLELMDGLVDVIFEPQSSALNMLTGHFSLASIGTLVKDDFDYLSQDFAELTKYLRKTRQAGKKGVNVLLYGVPGTGKSELARSISVSTNLQLFEVAMSDEDGNPLSGDRRFSAYQLSQQALHQQSDALILFDEIEDVFSDSFFNPWRSSEQRKAWVNRQLETNPVPAIWISNRIDQMDPAFLRRFDFLLEIERPPRRARERILKKCLAHQPVSEHWIRKVSERYIVAPALVSRAANVASIIGDGTTENTEQQVEQLLTKTLKAMGQPVKQISTSELVIPYRLDVLNPDHDIQELVEGLSRHPAGRICLYGPPGTGKTAFGKFAAKAVDRPLLIKRASDLLDPYVGMSERSIAKMFREAEEDNAVLLLDEADSFLNERQSAQHSWEVTLVNELLSQMENFEGLFICSTNLVERLDSASLRRFDLKIRFDYLTREQRCVLFTDVIKVKGAEIEEIELYRDQLNQISNLTPGDYATVVRQQRLRKGVLTPRALLDGLRQESQFKCDGRGTGIGFTATV